MVPLRQEQGWAVSVLTKYERETERDTIAFCKALGIRCKKLKPEGESGWPDRTLMYRGQVMFLELKRVGLKPEPLQQYVLDELVKDGFEAKHASNFEHIKLIILAWKAHVDYAHVVLRS